LQKYPYFVRAALLTLVCLAAGRLVGLRVLEDAYITFRCADNFAEGHGLNFNPDEPVESSSCFFFAVLLGLARRWGGVGPAVAAAVLNFSAYFFLLWALARRAGRDAALAPPSFPRTAGFWFAALHPGLWAYAHSGMETVFFTGLVFAGFLLLLDNLERDRPAWLAGVALGFAAITRMEAAGLAVLAVALTLVHGKPQRRWRDAWAVVLPFAAIFLPALFWRWHTYGHPLPLAYYVKVDGGGDLLTGRGVGYVGRWLFLNPLMPLTIVLGLRFWRAKTAIAQRCAVGLAWLLAYIGYVARVGGDYLPYFRFFLPVAPIAAWMIADQWPLWTAISRRKLIGLFVGAELLAAFFPFQLGVWWIDAGATASRTMIGEALHRKLPDRGTTLYTITAGALPYFSKLRAYDALGLTDPAVAFKRVELGAGKPGHEKHDVERIFALRPDIIVLGAFPNGTKLKCLPHYARTTTWSFVDGDCAVTPVPVPEAGPASTHWASTEIALSLLFAEPRFLDLYELMRLQDPALLALFYVRKDAPAGVRAAFAPYNLPLTAPEPAPHL